jgi:hypothetical protein
MVRLRCTRVPHPAYSHDFAICVFSLFGHIKDRVSGVTVVDADALRNEVMSILAEISEDQKSRAFEHWIERCEWVAEHGGDDSHISKDLADLSLHYHVSGVRC